MTPLCLITRRIKSKAEVQIKEFKDAIGLKDVNEFDEIEKKPAAKKRSVENRGWLRLCKEIAAVKNDAKALSKFTVNDLKSYLDSIGIKKTS